MIYTQEAEKLHAESPWGDRRIKTKTYCQEIICRACVPAVLLIIEMGLSKVGNRAKLLKHSEKAVVCYQLRKMLKRTATDLNIKATKTQHRLKWVFKNAEFLSEGSCCLKDVDNKILFRISWL